MFAPSRFFRLLPGRPLLVMGVSVATVLVGCSSDEGATKDDASPTADEAPAEEAPAEEAPAEEAPAEEPAAEAGPDLSVYDKAARVTQAKTSAGADSVRMSKVTPDGGYAACGLQDDDVLVSVAGADVPAGRPGVDAIIDACANKKPIVVERGGETLTLGAE